MAVITHPCPNTCGSLTSLPLKLVHGWAIASYWSCICNYLSMTELRCLFSCLSTHRTAGKVLTPNFTVEVYLSPRLLHSSSLVAVGLSVGYETWPPIGWHHAFVMGWSKYKLGLSSTPLHYWFTWPVGIPTVFQIPVTILLHSPNGRQMPADRVCARGLRRV